MKIAHASRETVAGDGGDVVVPRLDVVEVDVRTAAAAREPASLHVLRPTEAEAGVNFLAGVCTDRSDADPRAETEFDNDVVAPRGDGDGLTRRERRSWNQIPFRAA